METEKPYQSLNFVLGTTADAEWLFSKAQALLKGNDRRVTLITFEIILFLRENHTFWNLESVIQAMNAVRSEKVQQRMEEDNKQEDLD